MKIEIVRVMRLEITEEEWEVINYALNNVGRDTYGDSGVMPRMTEIARRMTGELDAATDGVPF